MIITFAFMGALTGCLITLYLFFRYVLIIGVSPLANIFWLTTFLIIGCIPLFIGYRAQNIVGRFYLYYRYGLYFVFITCIILWALTLIVDAGYLTGYFMKWFSFLPFNRTLCIKINLAVVVSAFILAGYALYEGIKIPEVKEVTLSSKKIFKDKKIVLLSDLHIHRVISSEKIQKIVDRVNALKPDIILLTGDIIDDKPEYIKDIVSPLKNLKASKGVYFVSGNHEFYIGYQTAVTELKNLGFRFLDNRGVNLGEIYLAGISDISSGPKYGIEVNLSQALNKAKTQQFRILMSHKPTDFEEQNNFDLEVSGHTHGGQIFPFHLLTILRNKYLAGLYNMNNGSKIYVSRGSGQWGPQMRFLAPSEITLFNITKE